MLGKRDDRRRRNAVAENAGEKSEYVEVIVFVVDVLSKAAQVAR
jgi:hypothetical protein